METEVFTMEEEEKRLNPWFSIWTKPRATMRQILDTDPVHMVLFIPILNGLIEGLTFILSGTTYNEFSLSLPMLILIGIVGLPLLYLAFLYITAALYKWVGSWLGGQASHEETRAAVAWTYVPTLYLSVASLLLTILLFLTIKLDMPELLMSLSMLVSVIFGIIQFAVSIWILIIASKTLGEAHRFSAWTGFGTIILSGILIVVPFIIIAIAASFLIVGLQ